jgi:anti-sigma regulatory factor (Ser/Thr protein kinase)
MEKRVLIERWLGSRAEALPIYDEASISTARQRVREVAQRLNLSRELMEVVAVIISELAHNQLSHAKQGYVAVQGVERSGVKGLEVIAADMGPGIARPASAIRGEIQKPDSLGAGLAAVSRLADEVAFDNRIAEGACVVARKFDKSESFRRYEPAIMGWPYPGEAISGDDAALIPTTFGFLAAVSDGLGHGPEARQASNRAIEVLIRNCELDLEPLVAVLHRELTGTRGCAMSIARFHESTRAIDCVSVGDVHSHLYAQRAAQFFSSTPLILGEGNIKRLHLRIDRENAPAGAILVMFSDGLKSRTNLKEQLDVLRLPSIAIAEHLLEHYSRPDDDALVLVVRT